MSHANDTPQATELDAALARLSRVDLEPLEARTLRVACERRLSGTVHPSPGARYEPAFLVGLSVAHLVWAVARVFVVR